MPQSDRTFATRALTAVGLLVTVMLTAAAGVPEGGLSDPTILAVILALVAVGVVALFLVRRRRSSGGPSSRPPTGG